jgi:hypothetical protein
MCAYYIPASHPGQYYQQPSFQPPASTYGGYGIPPGYAPTAYSDPGYARYSNDPYRYAGGGNTINVGGSVYSDGPRYATSPIGGAGPSWAGGSNYGRGAEPGPSPYRYNEPASAHYDPHRNGYLYPNAPQASQHPTDHSYGSEHRSRGRSRSRSQSRERRHSTGSYYPAGVPLGAKSQTYVVPTPANSYSGGGGGTKSGNRDRSRSRGRDTHIHLGSTSRNVSSAALPTNNIVCLSRISGPLLPSLNSLLPFSPQQISLANVVSPNPPTTPRPAQFVLPHPTHARIHSGTKSVDYSVSVPNETQPTKKNDLDIGMGTLGS